MRSLSASHVALALFGVPVGLSERAGPSFGRRVQLRAGASALRKYLDDEARSAFVFLGKKLLRMRGPFTICIALLVGSSSALAQPIPSSWSPIPVNAVFQTGDSWTDRGITYRLYGVQSCLRGTSFTNAHGLKRDCGEASLAMLIALMRDLQPQCYDAADVPETQTVFVFCVAQPSAGAAAGSRIDLGTALIATGYAFAALTPDGKPLHPTYFVAQLVAQRSKAGLWAFADLPEPNAIILRSLRSRRAVGSLPELAASSAATNVMPVRRPTP
jgi:endonuclease YncB( thermonuclease family)